jgi:hypothetical protein
LSSGEVTVMLGVLLRCALPLSSQKRVTERGDTYLGGMQSKNGQQHFAVARC